MSYELATIVVSTASNGMNIYSLEVDGALHLHGFRSMAAMLGYVVGGVRVEREPNA